MPALSDYPLRDARPAARNIAWYNKKHWYTGWTMHDDSLVQALRALGHPDRLRLLRLLDDVGQFPDNLVDPRAVGVCVNDLAAAAGLPQSTTSYHLGLLDRAGLLDITEHGQWRYVRPRGEALKRTAASVKALA